MTNIGAPYRERALDAVAASFDACIDAYEQALAAERGKVARCASITAAAASRRTT